MRKLVVSVLGVSCIKVIVTAFVRYGVQTILILAMSLRVSSMMSEATKCTDAIKQNTRREKPPGGCFGLVS
jgi:hypothetical protein